MSSPTNSRRGHLETSDTNNRNAIIFLCCPQSGGTYQIKSIDQFLGCKRLIWHMLLRKIEDGVRKQRIIGTLAVCNARDYAPKDRARRNFSQQMSTLFT